MFKVILFGLPHFHKENIYRRYTKEMEKEPKKVTTKESVRHKESSKEGKATLRHTSDH